MNIVIPMAGQGSRFSQAGYSFPKPLIDVEGVPMIERVVENLRPLGGKYIFLVRQEHLDRFALSSALRVITGGNCEIVPVPALTEGAACTVLLAKKFIDNSLPLVIANSDQIIEWQPENFITMINLAGQPTDFIFTFNATNPKWSFVRLNDYNRVVEVAEKSPISNVATCGIYYWSSGAEFVCCAEQMIRENSRINGEFYVAPTHNFAIARGRSIYPFYVDKMWGLGTPEDLNAYLNRP